MFRLFIIFIFSLSASKLTADDIMGALVCEIKSLDIIKMEDGKPKKYSGFKDWMEIGDKVSLTYIYTPSDRKFRINQFSNDFTFRDFTVDRLNKTPESGDGNKKIFSSEGGRIIIGEDKFTIDFTFLGVRNYIPLTRYYKDDWHGFYSTNDLENVVAFAGLDCRHPESKIDKILEAARKQN